MNGETVFTDGKLVEQTVDNGDGTGTRTTYTPEGEVESVEQLTGLPIPPDAEPEPDADRLIVAEEARRAAFDAFMQGKTNSVVNVLGATRAGSDAYLQALT